MKEGYMQCQSILAPWQPPGRIATFPLMADKGRLKAQGERIRELRKLARMSQEAIAREVGVTMRGYQAWERGESEIRFENLTRLADVLKVTPDFIEYGRPRARGETPDMAKTLDIGAEILKRLGEVQTQVENLAAQQLELQRRQITLYALIERLVADQVESAAMQDMTRDSPPPASKRRRRA